MELIQTAVRILRNGGLVAFPTETVYGLGADATNRLAVQKIFTAKGRPATNPLIVHVATSTIARRFTGNWPDIADLLAERFWPGPLTLVVQKTEAIATEAAAGGLTIGLRVPNHPLALRLLTEFDGAVAAPSANRSNHVSPTTAAHVHADLGALVDLILDGGPCSVGIESTVLDLTTFRPRILRPGGVSRSQIEAVIGKVDLFAGHVPATVPTNSPGQHERHYSPRTPAFRFRPEQWDQVARAATGKIAVMTLSINVGSTETTHVHRMPNDAAAYARDFYRVLRELDAGRFSTIYIEAPPRIDEWDAIHDRIQRATQPAGGKNRVILQPEESP